jgi:hypothetical protein
MSLSLDRLAATFALGYVGLFACLLAFTTDGPDPTLPPAQEMARAVSESSALRASALLDLATSLSFAGFAACLALILSRRGEKTAAALTAVAGAVGTAVDAVSAAGLLVAVEAADRGLGTSVFAAFGDLHTAALLFALPPFGIVLLMASRAELGRVVSWMGIAVGIACICAAGAAMSQDFDRGPLGVAVFIWFIGLPVWLIATAIVLIRRGRGDVARTGEPSVA